MGAKHNKCCCPTATCLIGEDDFDRANENPVTGNWAELGGDWEVLDNELNSLSNGVLITTLRQSAPTVPGAQYSIVITVEIIDIVAGIWEIICGYSSGSTYDSIRLTDDGTGDIYPEFLRNGVSIMDKTTHPEGAPFQLSDGKLQVNICYAESEWSIGSAISQTVWTACDEGGLASLPANPAHGMAGFYRGRFDNWTYSIHYDSNRSCFWCNCACRLSTTDTSCIPETLTLSLVPQDTYSWSSPSPGSCDPPSTLTVTLYQQIPDTTGAAPVYGASKKTAQKFIWRSDLLEGDPPGLTTAVPYELWFALICDSDDMWLVAMQYPNDYTIPELSTPLDHWVTPDSGWNSNARLWDRNDSTCDPLSLSFPNFKFDRTAPSQCWVYGENYDCYVTL